MNESTQTRLAAILERRAEADRKSANRRQIDDEAKVAREAVKLAASKRWERSFLDVKSALTIVNAEITASGLALEMEHESGDIKPALARLSIILVSDGRRTDNKMSLNVNAFGMVQTMILIPYVVKGPANFDIKDANESTFQDVLIGFLEHAA